MLSLHQVGHRASALFTDDDRSWRIPFQQQQRWHPPLWPQRRPCLDDLFALCFKMVSPAPLLRKDVRLIVSQIAQNCFRVTSRAGAGRVDAWREVLGRPFPLARCLTLTASLVRRV